MTQRVIRGGSFRETFTNTVQPNDDNSKKPHLRVTSGQCRVFLKFNVAGIRRQTISSAVLRCRVKDTWAAQTLTVTPVDERMTLRLVNANHLPTLRTGQAVSAGLPSRTDGQYVEIPITAFLQTIADGAENYGLQITTSSSVDNRFYGTESKYKNDTWQLVYEIVEKPDPPTDLSPNGGVLETGKPVLSSAFRDPGGESKILAALQAQVGVMSLSTFVPSWDSGTVATDKPRLRLVDTSYPGASDGETPKWRMRHMDGAGYWSDWSDVAEWTTDFMPTITLTNPVGGVVYDPTPTLAFSIGSGVVKAWRLRITKGEDRTRILYDTGKKPGGDATTITHRIPFRDPDTDKRILRDDETYWGSLRVWDRLDREATSEHPTYTELWFPFTLDDDHATLPPSAVQAVQIGDTPSVRITWDLPGGYSEGYVIRLNGQVIARLDTDEVTVDGTLYSWTYDGAQPLRANKFTVQAIYDGKQTIRSPEAIIEPQVAGVWLLGDGVQAKLDGLELSGLTATDKRARHERLNAPSDVDIIYALRGVEGTYTGTFSSRDGQDWEATYDALMAMRESPETPIQLVFGTLSRTVKASISEPMPDGQIQPSNMRHTVLLTVQQSDDFQRA